MGKEKLVDKTIQPLAAGGINVAQATGRPANQLGVLPIGYYKGRAVFVDLDKAVNQPLILAEKQWTLDKVDPRKGHVSITVPIGTAVGSSIIGEIEVPAGEVWYLCDHEIIIPQVADLTAGDISVNFRVSSFPKVNEVDKTYYDPNDPQVYLTTGGAKVTGGGLTATQAEIAAGDINDHQLEVTHGWKTVTVDTEVTSEAADWVKELKRDFRKGDELNNELRLVGGDILTLVATVATDAIAGAAVAVHLRVWGRVGKALVA